MLLATIEPSSVDNLWNIRKKIALIKYNGATFLQYVVRIKNLKSKAAAEFKNESEVYLHTAYFPFQSPETLHLNGQ